MLLRALPNSRQVLSGERFRKLRRNLVEMEVLEQLESGRTENMRILQRLHGRPITALDQHRKRRAGNGNHHGLFSREKPMHDTIARFVSETASKNTVDVPFHHSRHRQPPKRVDDSQNVGAANVGLGLENVCARWMFGTYR
jgi:hypothetical protein